MRGIAAAAAAARRHTPLPSSLAPAFSSFSGIGGGDGGFGRGRGRGRGRGLPPSEQPRYPGRPISDDDGSDPFSAAVSGGCGRGEPVVPSSPTIPSFVAFSGAGRGRGSPLPPPPPPEGAPKQPTFTRRFDDAPQRPDPEPPSSDASSSEPPLPGALPFSGAGRGVPPTQKPMADKPLEENRFIRRREAAKQAGAGPPSAPSAQQPKLSREDALKRALEILGGGAGGRDGEGGGGRGGGGRGNRGRGGRGRGRGRGFTRNDRQSTDVDEAIFLGDKADGERLEQRLGEDKMKILEQAFMEAADNALPNPAEDAYLEACHTNNMIEFEPEYLVNFGNPDIDEKPPMSLEEMLQKVKPFIIAYEGIQNQEEWEEAVKDVMARAPHMKELIDMYSGPDVVTAKQQEEELQRVANTLPESIPSSVKRFTDKTLLSLKNNPGWGFDKKCQFMDKFTRIVSEQYK